MMPPSLRMLRLLRSQYDLGPEPELRPSGSGTPSRRLGCVRQRGSHVRLQKHVPAETLKLIIPAHQPIKRSTLSHILKQARLTVEEFERLL
jgi:hypothetical protein